MDIIEQLTQDIQFLLGEHFVKEANQDAFVLGAVLILKSLDASTGEITWGCDEGQAQLDNLIRDRISQWMAESGQSALLTTTLTDLLMFFIEAEDNNNG